MRLSFTEHFYIFTLMSITELATSSTLDIILAEVRGEVVYTKLPTKKPSKSLLVMSQTKGNRCRTNRSSGTNFVTSIA